MLGVGVGGRGGEVNHSGNLTWDLYTRKDEAFLQKQ